MKEELEFVVNSFIFYCSAKRLVYSGFAWIIHRHYYRLYAIHKQNRVGMICVYKGIYWMNMSWMCEDCIPWRWIDTWWMIGRKEKRTFCTLDSNPFNDVYSILILFVIMIMRNEWKELKTDENVIGCDLKSDSISVIHNRKWMSNAQIWYRSGYGLWLSLECYTILNHWCWQGHSV